MIKTTAQALALLTRKKINSLDDVVDTLTAISALLDGEARGRGPALKAEYRRASEHLRQAAATLEGRL